MANGDNLRPEWLSVAARMQQVACTENSNAVLNMHILVDRSGNPVFWFEPDIVRIEPSARLTEAISYLIRSRNGL